MVTERQLQEAIQHQVLYGGRLGTNLHELGFITEERLQEALARAHGVPAVPVDPRTITPELVARAGQIDTILCHTDFDGLASAAKWIRDGVEPYPGCDDDARAIDTRIGTPSAVAERIDRALRARFRDQGLFGVIVRHLATGLADATLWEPIDQAAEELVPVERETRRAAQAYKRLEPGVAAYVRGCT